MAYTMICVNCGHAIHNDFHYCPGCGKLITHKALSTSVPKQLFIYMVSFCFAPFGLRWVIPYLRERSLGAKLIGVMALVLTITSVSIAIFSVSRVAAYYSKLLNSLDNPSQQLIQKYK